MTISEVADKYGITRDTLRYYERIGLIPPSPGTRAESEITTRLPADGYQ